MHVFPNLFPPFPAPSSGPERTLVLLLTSLLTLPALADEPGRPNIDPLSPTRSPVEIRWTTRQLDPDFYGEGASAGDIDGDGHVDIVSGPYWYAGPDFETRYPIYPPKPFDPHGYSDHFFSFVADINGNGRRDVLVIGFPGAEAFWYENPGADSVRAVSASWKRHLALDSVENESPTFTDLTGNGRPEIVCSRQGHFGYAGPDPADPTKPWKFVAISDQSAGGRFTHGLGVGDIDGDGRMDLLEKSGWWRQPESLAGDPVWEKHPFAFSQAGGSQMLVTDVDGDGLNDVITAVEAHGYGIVWYRQRRAGDRILFEPYPITGRHPRDSPFGVVFSQPHAMTLADIDGDGLPDLVTGKRWWAHGPHGDPEPNAPAVVKWFRLQRRPDAPSGPPAVFVPHRIHDDSGVGTDVQVHDLTGNGHPDVVVGNKRGTFVHLQTEWNERSIEERRRDRPIIQWEPAKPAAELATEGLTPEQARDAMTVPPGFHVDLVAAEPRIHQPVAFTFDTRGRLWVAEAHTYPVRAAEGDGDDRIVVLEDTNGDGEFDSRTVFIEGLNLVSGLEVGFGGVWVGAAPYLLFIPDADGDAVPDGPPETLLDGWGYQDTHETLNAFNWGPDGWLYGCQGVFTHSRVGKPGTPDDQRVAINAGVWRYHPGRHRFEVFAHGTSNPWGVDFDDHGQCFITACVIEHAYHVVQGGRYKRQAGRHFDPYTFDDLKTIADHQHYAGNIRDHAWWGRNEAVHDDATSAAGGGHAHCGAMVYLGDNWPTGYRNTLMMANIHGNRINLEHLRRDGSGFIAGHGHDVIYANDGWFRGINLRYGPDGAVYLIDWYDPNACHRASPEIWDRTNGRLFRVRYGDLSPRPVNLNALADDELLELHGHANDWFVRAARRVLQHRHAGDAVAEHAGTEHAGIGASLRAESLARAEDGLRPVERRLRYLWTAHVLSPLTDGEVRRLLGDGDENLRAWAIQLLTDRPSAEAGLDGDGVRLGSEVLDDIRRLTAAERSPRVRLYLASLLQRLCLADRWELAPGLVSNGDHANDPNLPLITWYGVAPLVADDASRAIDLAERTRLPQVRQFIYRRAAVDPALLPPLVARLADDADPDLAKLIIGELRRGAEQWGKTEAPPRWADVVRRYGESDDAQVREQVRFLSITFGDASIFPVLRQTARDGEQPPAARREALTALAQGRDEQLLGLCLDLLDAPQLRADAMPLLARFDSDEIAAAVIGRYGDWPDSHRRAAIDLLISRPRLAHQLLDSIESGDAIPPTDLTAVHVGRIRGLGDESLLERLGEIWGTVRPTSEAIREEIDRLSGELSAETLAEADPSLGRALYAKSCGQCHTLFGQGGNLGPDLTGADRGNVRYWLENILDPNAVVGKDYQTVSVLTEDGRVVTGLLRQETDVAVVLEDAEKRVTIPRGEIEQMRPNDQSLMPEGLLQGLRDTEIAGLVAYLRSPGQVPLPGQVPGIDPETGRVPGAIEGESLEVLRVTGGRVQRQAMGQFPRDVWSNASHLWWVDGKPGDTLNLGFPVTAGGDYEIVAVMTKAVDYGSVALRVNDHDTPTVIDLFNKPDVITTGPVSLGTHVLEAGIQRLRVTLGDPHPEAVPRHMFGIDYLLLLPVTATP